MNILVTGANGQLGNEMRLLSPKSKNNYYFTDVAELDITNKKAIQDFVADNNTVTPEANIESVMLREHIDVLLKDLKERDAYAKSVYTHARKSRYRRHTSHRRRSASATHRRRRR